MRLASCDDDRIAIRRSQIGVTRVTRTTGGVVPDRDRNPLSSAEADWSGITLIRPRRARRARRLRLADE